MHNPLRTGLFIFSFMACLVACKKEGNDPVVVPNPIDTAPTGYVQYGSPFANVPSTKDIIMYEINLRAFSNGGDMAGVIERLDALQELHVNVLWLMPIYPIGTINSVNSPYCISDYKAVDSEFGTLNILRLLVSEAHERGMAVVLDWVANHTSWDHPWITSHPNWYTQDGSGNIIIPPGTNWNDVADLNFDNADMRLAMIDAMKYWVYEANVDGFRYDYADGVPFDFWQQTIDSLETIPNHDLIYLAEGDRSDHYDAGFDMTYSWDFYGSLINLYNGSSPSIIFTTSSNEYTVVPEGKGKLRFTTNHDESAWNATPMTLFNGKAGATAASVITTYMDGLPLIYTGQEVGTSATVPFFYNSTINWNANQDMLIDYQEMLGFYSTSEAARYGTKTVYANSDIVSFKKSYNSEEILIIANPRNFNVTYTFPAELSNTTWTNALTNEPVTLGTAMVMSAYQYLILN